MLSRLILVHGRTRYLSISEFILYFFYKNFVLTMPQFFFAYMCGFSATSFFDDFYINLYNAFFTAVAPCGLGIYYWDVYPDLDETALLPDSKNLMLSSRRGLLLSSKNPPPINMNGILTKLYSVGQLRRKFNAKTFFKMQLQAFYDSVIIFFIPFYGAMWSSQITNGETGSVADMWTVSITAFTALIFIIHTNILLRFRHITIVHMAMVLIGGLLSYFSYMWIGNFPEFSQTRFAVLEAHETPIFYLTVACCIACSSMADFALQAYTTLFQCSPTDYLRITMS